MRKARLTVIDINSRDNKHASETIKGSSGIQKASGRRLASCRKGGDSRAYGLHQKRAWQAMGELRREDAVSPTRSWRRSDMKVSSESDMGVSSRKVGGEGGEEGGSDRER
jgi:hypothetical protein